MSVNAALASLGQQTSHSLQSLCFNPRNVIVYFIVVGIGKFPLRHRIKESFRSRARRIRKRGVYLEKIKNPAL